MGYTWEELMNEKVPQTMYSFEQLEIEGKKKKERRENLEKEQDKVKSKV